MPCHADRACAPQRRAAAGECAGSPQIARMRRAASRAAVTAAVHQLVTPRSEYAAL